MVGRENKSVTISVCMIVRDEEPVLERCLKNAMQFADEIVIVDTGSVDATVDIAKRFTDKTFDYVWHDDFAAARNYSYEKATCDYIMWLDADDDFEAEDIERMQDLKKHMPPETDVVFLTYTSDPEDDNNYSDGIVLRDRMIRRSLNARWSYPIHEAIPIRKEWKRLMRPDIRIYHRKVQVNEPGRNIRIFERKLSEGFQMDAFNRSYYCRELVSSGQYEEGIKVYNKIQEEGVLNCIIYALPFFITAMSIMKRHEELAATLEAHPEWYEKNEVALCTLGDLMRRSGANEKAEKYYYKAINLEINLDDLQVHFPAFYTYLPWIGICRIRLSEGNIDLGEEAVQKAAEFRPKNLNVMLLKLYIERQRRRK